MSVYNWLSLLFGSGVLLAAGRYVMARFRANEQKTEAVCLGVQALLRDRLYHEYNKALEVKYAPIYAKENFENMWKQYHNLGVNGVMDEIHKTYMALPTERRNDHDEVV